MAWPSFSIVIEKLRLSYPKINAYFAAMKNTYDAHIAGTADKHAADKITYDGTAGGTEVKTALNSLKTEITNLSFTGSQHDALVTASMVDEEGTDFGAGGEATYLDGRLGKWEQKHIAHLADNVIQLAGKVDKVAGKGLSEEDYTSAEKAKVAKVEYLKTHGNRFVRALGNRLTMAIENACILLQGDSTGNDGNEWFYTTIAWFMQKFPAYSFLYKIWNDGTQTYSAGTTIQTGTGGEYYVNLAAGGAITTPDSASLDITGDIDIIAKVAANVWGNGAAQTIVAKFGVAGQRGWALAINAIGIPYFWWSNDGTTNLTEFATASIGAPDGSPLWLRVRVDVDNGSGLHTIEFNTSLDGVTWTLLGDVVFTAGAISFFSNTSPVEIGRRSGANDVFVGKIYEVTVKSGINGTTVAHVVIDNETTNPFTDAQGNVWTINANGTIEHTPPVVTILNASMPGGGIAYSIDVTRFGLQTPLEPQLAFINYSHNESGTTDYQTTYEGLATQILTKYPNAGIVCVAQNPQTPPAPHIKAHAIRNRQIAMLAAKNNYGLVDAYRAFMETGDPESYVVDGYHPNQAGYDLWRDEAIKFLFPAVQ